ncbi:hypothetical protein [Chryseobacterium salviniae]|uniref:SH3 domain-containing protein n=1 Tax=Chryseobacterium salviniae TaxID=3101750 RepID=A0ABU6HNN7_9FLAO|nr:hypothetical protein [Chryseobacterium sp. T9W2-O]MEC3874196.1 hypothetical protein [Chryseobacterium sp. T9W2-O]
MKKCNMAVFLFRIFVLVFAIACNGQEKKETTDKSKTTMEQLKIEEIKKYIALQKNVETEEYEPQSPHELSEKDLNLAAEIISEGLKNSGFQKFSEDIFKNKVLNIFGVKHNEDYSKCKKIYSTNSFITLFGDEMDGNRQTLISNQYDLFYYTHNYFISKKQRLILPMYLLKDIISVSSQNKYNIKIPQRIIFLNKYIFNDDKASLAWLKVNDKDFLRSLVLNFGYTKDKDLLKWVMESVKLKINPQENNANEFGKLLWHKDCSGTLKIHNETFELMHENNKKELPKYEDDVLEYIFYLNDEKSKLNIELTFAERARISAYCLHFMQKETNDIYQYIGKFAKYSDQDNSFSKEFEKNNYYDIPNFRQEWKEAKEEGDGTWYPGMEGAFNNSDETEKASTIFHLHDRPDFSSFSREILAKGEIEIVHSTKGWDFVKIDGVTGYLATEEAIKEKEKMAQKKFSFLAEEESEEKSKKRKGFWDNLLG